MGVAGERGGEKGGAPHERRQPGEVGTLRGERTRYFLIKYSEVSGG